MSDAFVGKMYLERGTGVSPEVYARVCQVFGMSGVGQQNELVEVTTFCSGGNKEYVGGLADGSEITLNLNFETADWAGANPIPDMIDDVKNKATRNFRIIADDEVNASVEFYFAASCMSWELGPSVDGKNTINFGIKVSGDITVLAGA